MQTVVKRAVLVVFLGILLTTPVAAQQSDRADGSTATSTPSESPAEDQLENEAKEAFEGQLVITALKKEDDVQKVPISLTSFDQDAMLDLDVDRMISLDRQTPNLQINTDQAGGANAGFQIRGVGFKTDGDEIVSQPVAVHGNEVASPYSATTLGMLFDIQQVEVLRGPQGDLFGLNTTAGAINYVTAKPTDTFTSGVFAELGNFESFKVDAHVSGPLSRTWSARLAVATRQRNEGWQTNVETGEKYGELNTGGTRLSFRHSGERVLADVEIHYLWDRSDSVLGRLVAPYTTVFGEEIEPVTEWTGVGWSEAPAFSTSARRPFVDSDTWGMTANINWSLGSLSLVSVTGFQDFKRTGWYDRDGSRTKEADTVRSTDARSFSQEFRLSSKASSPFYWMAGVYYGADELENTYIADIAESRAFPAVIGHDPTLQDRDAWAAFGRGEWSLSERWRIDLGLRYSREKRSISQDATQLLEDRLGVFEGIYVPGDIITNSVTRCLSGGDCTPGVPYADQIDDDDWSGRLSLSFAPSSAWNIYGSIARGFKSGGFNDSAATATAQLLPVGPERLYAYEVGTKALFIDDSLRWNSAVFFYDFKDQQVQDWLVDPLFGPVSANTNVPETEIYGFETEFFWQPARRLSVVQGIGFKRGSFVDFPGIDRAAVEAQDEDPDFEFYTPVYLDRAGESIGFPELQYNGQIEYLLPVTGRRAFRFLIEYNYVSEEEPPGDSRATLPAHWLVNARVAFRLNNDLEIGLWGRNLLDEQYLVRVGSFLNALTHTVGFPRTFGISLRWGR